MKKDLIIVVVAAVIVVVSFIGLNFKYNKAVEEAEYWYQKYRIEKDNHNEDLKNLSEIVFDAYRNNTVLDHGYSLWFEDLEYCPDGYCAVYIEPGVTHIIKSVFVK